MKKIITVFALLLVAQISMGQSCKQTCMKDKFVQNNGLIEATIYHENGVVAQKGFYNANNKLQGEWVSYDLQGNKTAVAYYNNGKKTGTWLFYNGNDIKEVTFMDSKIAKVKTWKDSKVQIVSN